MSNISKNIEKYIYKFNEVSKDMIDLVGNKGLNLGTIISSNYRTPKAVIISSNLIEYYKTKNSYPDNFIEKIKEYLEFLEKTTGKTFGDPNNPLLVSVRSSGNISLPGILETILNVGLNTHILKNWNVNNELKKNLYEKNLCKHQEDPLDQILMAINIVIKSMEEEKFKVYSSNENITSNFKLAIIIQEMVFGNLDNNSYTGVVFSSDETGSKLFGEILHQAQGDLLVNGSITPVSVDKLPQIIYEELFIISKKLETHQKYIQDIEFTVESGVLYILQTRNARLTNKEQFKMLENFVKKNIITKEEFFQRAPSISQVKNKQINYDKEQPILLGNGISIVDSVISGHLALNYEKIIELKKEGKNVIYCTIETNQNHMKCLVLADGLITVRGGATSHAAVIARGKNMVCILSVKNLEILSNNSGIKINNHFIQSGSLLTLDGNKGNILDNKVVFEQGIESFDSTNWKINPMKVKMNGETLEDIKNGHNFAMDGIGLCRIEHMFLEEEGSKIIKQFLIKQDNKKALEGFLKKNFLEIFKSMNNLPITIRLLDPPLHEFLPSEELKEHNPMMGNRGARLMISHENLCRIQIRGIFEAYLESKSKSSLEIMVPFVFGRKEILYIKELVTEVSFLFPSIKYKFGIMVELPRIIFVLDKICQDVDFVSFGTNDLTQMTFGLSRDDSGSIIQKYMELGLLDYDPFQKLDSVLCELIQIAVKKARSVNPDIEIGICGEQGVHEDTLEFFSNLKIDYISCSPFRIEQLRFELNKLYCTKRS